MLVNWKLKYNRECTIGFIKSYNFYKDIFEAMREAENIKNIVKKVLGLS